MRVLTAKGLEKLNNISVKYRFQDTFEIEQHEASQFCHDLLRCVHLGLNMDEDDKAFIIDVIEKLEGGN
jgi:hypothetical protein